MKSPSPNIPYEDAYTKESAAWEPVSNNGQPNYEVGTITEAAWKLHNSLITDAEYLSPIHKMDRDDLLVVMKTTPKQAHAELRRLYESGHLKMTLTGAWERLEGIEALLRVMESTLFIQDRCHLQDDKIPGSPHDHLALVGAITRFVHEGYSIGELVTLGNVLEKGPGWQKKCLGNCGDCISKGLDAVKFERPHGDKQLILMPKRQVLGDRVRDAQANLFRKVLQRIDKEKLFGEMVGVVSFHREYDKILKSDKDLKDGCSKAKVELLWRAQRDFEELEKKTNWGDDWLWSSDF